MESTTNLLATDAELAGKLARIPGWETASLEASALGGGITNRNYRVRAGDRDYVVRICGEGTGHLGIDREHEYQCNRIAAGLGIAPTVEHFLPGEGMLVTRFIEGEELTAQTSTQPGALARIMATIRAYHQGPAFPGRFSPFQVVRSYHRRAVEHGVQFPERFEQDLVFMANLESALAGRASEAPCHNDLLAGNLLDDGERIWVLDWEYAGMGDPLFDLGNFAVNQNLDAGQCEFILSNYRGSIDFSELAHLHLMRIASELREALWGYLQSVLSDLDFDYMGYGKEHLERFRENAADPQAPRWLAAVQG
jgi:thiamine kinase-like enzyme